MKKMRTKTVRETAVEEAFHEVEPKDLNASDTLFGGELMHHLLDKVGGKVAQHHSGRVCVTRHAEIDIAASAYLGETLFFKASLNRAWESSMEVGMKVTAVDFQKVTLRYIGNAYVTFVALDDERRPVAVPAVIPRTLDQKRRYREAEDRRAFYRRKKKS
ncbi:MAG: Thioesterase family protein [Parcubacteria group bacterium GW2011_GWA2_45_30]|nr:MAG: Thioesterase family protein [Parcubacteria group bacterium GW2011_GWA2_45_30]